MRIIDYPGFEFRFIADVSEAMRREMFLLSNTALQHAANAAACDCQRWYLCDHGDRAMVELWLLRYRKIASVNDGAALAVLAAASPTETWRLVDALSMGTDHIARL